MRALQIETGRGPAAALVWDGAGPAAPWLHFAHATGMHAALYARLLAPLAGQFNIIASDARGHGADGRPLADPERLDWTGLAHDTLAIMDSIAPAARWWLMGHSLGAGCALIAATEAPARVAGLLMLEPPLIPFAVAAAARASGEPLPNPLAEQATRRRADFPDLATARASYAGRGVFREFSDGDLDAYLEAGFHPSGSGITLACPPAVEAASFRAAPIDIEPRLARLDRPFALLAGTSQSTIGEAELAAFAAHPRCHAASRIPGTGHFLPLQAPDAVQAMMRALVG